MKTTAAWDGREIDDFLLFIATERGLSTAYQLSIRQSLDALCAWCRLRQSTLQDLGTEELSSFLTDRKKKSLEASSLRITTVHLKIFFRWLAGKGYLTMDPAEPLHAPRAEKILPETLNANECRRLLDSGVVLFIGTPFVRVMSSAPGAL
jgi:integrase/recombinase XerD